MRVVYVCMHVLGSMYGFACAYSMCVMQCNGMWCNGVMHAGMCVCIGGGVMHVCMRPMHACVNVCVCMCVCVFHACMCACVLCFDAL